MKKIFFALTLFAFTLLNACASINSLSLTPIPANRNQMVKAEASKFVFLGFNFNNDFIDTLTQELKEQCTNGVVTGILTKDEVISYFLAHTRRVTATGYCVPSQNIKNLRASNGDVK